MTELAGPVALEVALAGFIVWLARQRSPLPTRSRCPNAVERFLRWQHVARARGGDATQDTYCAELLLGGASEAEVAAARGAIDQFRRFLLATG